jgi:hypothetical protein
MHECVCVCGPELFLRRFAQKVVEIKLFTCVCVCHRCEISIIIKHSISLYWCAASITKKCFLNSEFDGTTHIHFYYLHTHHARFLLLFEMGNHIL